MQTEWKQSCAWSTLVLRGPPPEGHTNYERGCRVQIKDKSLTINRPCRQHPQTHESQRSCTILMHSWPLEHMRSRWLTDRAQECACLLAADIHDCQWYVKFIWTQVYIQCWLLRSGGTRTFENRCWVLWPSGYNFCPGYVRFLMEALP